MRPMDLHEFTTAQKLATLDLLILAMYADGHLATAEDQGVQRLLTAMGFETEYERQREFDASVTRVRQHGETADAARAQAARLARGFTSPEQRRRVYELIGNLVKSDSCVSKEEVRFLAFIRDIFHL
jgi:uncharacterized tellurite resistance protein B-like protein